MPLLPFPAPVHAVNNANSEAQLWRNFVQSASVEFDEAARSLQEAPQNEAALVAFKASANRLMDALAGRYRHEAGLRSSRGSTDTPS